MTHFETRRLPAEPDACAPDGAEVRLLGRLAGGSMAHFRLAAGQVSRAVTHRTVEEIWYVVAGNGEMWRQSDDGAEELTRLGPGVALTIPLGTTFQFRADGTVALEAVAVTMPPWPGPDEALEAEGPWRSTA
jgi:mannose-6-phosphate isomerase-like protein (cupin superfamily)